MDEEELRPLRPIGPSFAAVGAAAGGFGVLAMGLVAPGSRLVNPAVAALAGAVAGALVGGWMRRSRGLRNPMVARENVLLRLAVWVVGAGALAGLATGAATQLTLDTPLRATGAGAALGLSLLPACHAALQAALREAEARKGSVVARAGAGRVRLAVVVPIALLALAGAVSISLGAASLELGLRSQLALSAGVPVVCAAFALLTSLDQRRAQAHVEELARDQTRCEEAEPDDALASEITDLGVGDERWAAVRQTQAYRRGRDALVVLLGNVDEARSAIGESRRSVFRSLALVVAVCAVALPAVALRAAPVALSETEPAEPAPPGLEAYPRALFLSSLSKVAKAPAGEAIPDELDVPVDEIAVAPARPHAQPAPRSRAARPAFPVRRDPSDAMRDHQAIDLDDGPANEPAR